jgi:hypothetical protein
LQKNNVIFAVMGIKHKITGNITMCLAAPGAASFHVKEEGFSEAWIYVVPIRLGRFDWLPGHAPLRRLLGEKERRALKKALEEDDVLSF